MAQWTDYLKLLGQLTKTVSQLAEIERKKAEAAGKGSVAGVEDAMRQEQVMSLSLRGIDQKREKMLAELGLQGVPLRGLVERSPEGLEVETRKAVEELQRQYDLFQSASSAARSTLEINLRAMELYCAENEIELPKELETRRQTDFRA